MTFVDVSARSVQMSEVAGVTIAVALDAVTMCATINTAARVDATVLPGSVTDAPAGVDGTGSFMLEPLVCDTRVCVKTRGRRGIDG